MQYEMYILGILLEDLTACATCKKAVSQKSHMILH